ncbi:hypothetical protein FQN54_002488 [Arachnomyces sp. PD_36]|nr:hypothetical protein FQN54_002488 [Arachnomyces sp. PD_36]
MKTFLILLAVLTTATSASPTTVQPQKRADPNLVGYLGAFFLGDQPKVYFDLSNGNDPLSFSPLNGGEPVLTPTAGTGGVRDPSIIKGGGDEEGSKWYLIGTDLDIGKTDWDAAQRHGSLGIFVWESTDLVEWTNERLVVVEDDTAGMVWAPDAIWDPEQGQYLVHWASRFYDPSDPDHTGTPSESIMRYAHTSDFQTFTPASTLIDATPTSIIDLNILPLTPNTTTSYARFLKNESVKNVYMERSDTGLFGTWTRVGGEEAIIREGVEGPAAYLDNEVEGKAYLLLDYYGEDGYHPLESTDLDSGEWVDSDRSEFPVERRHGSVIGVDGGRYEALKAGFGG